MVVPYKSGMIYPCGDEKHCVVLFYKSFTSIFYLLSDAETLNPFCDPYVRKIGCSPLIFQKVAGKQGF